MTHTRAKSQGQKVIWFESYLWKQTDRWTRPTAVICLLTWLLMKTRPISRGCVGYLRTPQISKIKNTDTVHNAPCVEERSTFFTKKTPPFSTFLTKEHPPFSTFLQKKHFSPFHFLPTGLKTESTARVHAMCCAASLQRGEWLLYYNVQADVIVNFHIGEVLMSLQKATLIPGGSESLVYTTLSGGIGMLVPFTAHEVCV